ncbi:MAG: hypothetical protein HYV04_10045, partial [Deltaproteobacteria bacterium]|nr:hypothetical protein [Deltaproteobacteria bacterium]
MKSRAHYEEGFSQEYGEELKEIGVEEMETQEEVWLPEEQAAEGEGA